MEYEFSEFASKGEEMTKWIRGLCKPGEAYDATYNVEVHNKTDRPFIIKLHNDSRFRKINKKGWTIEIHSYTETVRKEE